MIQFEWDPAKARANQRKHGVSFDDAMRVFDDPYALFEPDPSHEAGEPRWRAVGLVEGVILLVVAYTVRERSGTEVVRLISARRATRKERFRYEQTRAQNSG